MTRRLSVVLALCGLIAVVGGVVPAGASAAGRTFSTRITLVNLSGKTLIWDQPGSFAHSRTDTEDGEVETAHYLVQPKATLAHGQTTTIRLAGHGIEGLYAGIKYQDSVDANKNVTVEAHLHLAPHGHWLAGWSDAGFAVAFNQDAYTNTSVDGTGIITSV